jgi:molybdenum cofactor biosynthesis enzyme MoaA
MSTGKPDNFYCSQKFTWLSVDMEKHLSYSCCTALPEKIDISWLKNNPGNIFNTPVLHQDRVDMLENQPVASCDEACWKPESRGLASRRIKMKSYDYIDYSVDITSPTDLNFMLGSTCNLTCSYCCKQYSSAWYRDINEQGPYVDYENRYKLIPLDHAVRKVSHNELETSDTFQTLMHEMSDLQKVQRITVSGGEPFLYNRFPDLLNKFNHAESVIFYTGLGVDSKRLRKQVKSIQIQDNLEVVISAENCNELYEFNRYGISYQDFLTNLQIIVDAGLKVKFNSVLSNLTLFGIIEFAEKFKSYPIMYSFCNSPDFLAVNVLDDTSKSMLIDCIKSYPILESDLLISSLQQPYQEQQKQQFVKFINEFSRRRRLSLDIFPTSMLKWLKL